MRVNWSCHDNIDWEEPTKNKTCMYTVCMTTYERVKPATPGPVADTYLELKILCLFYFFFESEKIAIMSGLQWSLKNDSIFPLFYSFFFNLNSICKLNLGSIHPKVN